jgi:DNA end-binding protein Ku
MGGMQPVAVWRGALTFGLVHLGVRASSATESQDPRAYLVHRADGGRIRHHRQCSVCGHILDPTDITRSYPLGPDRRVVLDDADLARLPLPTVRAMEIVAFVPLEDIDPTYFDRVYYLAPDTRATVRPYVLLRDTLRTTGRVGIGKIALREREALAVVRARADVLVLHTLLWPDEIREPDFPFQSRPVEVGADELAAAGALVEAMSGRLASLEAELGDDYRQALRELIAARAEGVALPETAEAAEALPSVQPAELMEVLERSVQTARARRQAGKDQGGLALALR